MEELRPWDISMLGDWWSSYEQSSVWLQHIEQEVVREEISGTRQDMSSLIDQWPTDFCWIYIKIKKKKTLESWE